MSGAPPRVGLAAGMLALGLLLGCASGPTEPDTYTVEYRADGSVPAVHLEWTDHQGAPQSEAYAIVPWRRSYAVRKGWSFQARIEIPANLSGWARLTVYRDGAILAQTPEIQGAGASATLP